MGVAKKIAKLGDAEYRGIVDYNNANVTDSAIEDHIKAVGTAQFQKEYGLEIDGKCGPITQAEIEKVLGGTDVILPKGKGIFIRSFGHTGTPSEMIDTLVNGGWDFVVVQIITQYVRQGAPKLLNLGDQWNDHWNALKSAGIDSWVWGWPVPGQTQGYIDRLRQAKEQHPFIVGHIDDNEVDWYNQQAQAKAFAAQVTAAARSMGMGSGISTFGAPWFHDDFPFEEFAEYYGFVNSQNYDMSNSLGPDYPTQSHDAFRDLGYKHIVPAGPGWDKTPEQLAVLFANTPRPDGGYICWDWYNLDQNPKLWNVWNQLEV